MNPINTPLTEQLAELTNRLFWLSESEFPFQIITWDTERVTIEQLLKLTYHPPNTPVQTLTIDEFFAPALAGIGSFSFLLDQTLIGRYRTLYNYLTYYLQNIKVYQVGTHPLYIYIMGVTRDENLAGIATQVLETIPQSSRIYPK
ncbi:nuclease A inhibitor family protein [Laspinema olomoucense]|uniref:Nuclease A inhibitor family protein n=1 Tax=Laspinema olomoucense D3b TaxID=2953688 RepID=A0ABT2NGB5_9CYAN|nr:MULTISPECIES: nuclease A inhibitor family protein [unclassified Laspinema]MCT7973892.1 nuclease A inhibitor family protein [Laspinema sp. D3d]MCT7981556.1 nuclease A inhibitor family protein [Laspinema sp. D3b]MCT7991926.1 nuclease A inhibitor family protein [Laspinema sp. D3a]MCT7997427.1 nuclease A inhibitor family protein [Laspinema sp. D3c]